MTSKIHIAVDALGNPLRFILTGGQVGDITQAEGLIADVPGEYVIADKAYDGDDFRAHLDDPAIAELHEAALQAAHRRGAFGVPTFFLGERMFWGNDRLVLLEHFIEKARADAGA